MIRTLLQVPLAAKLLVANGVLLGAAAAAGFWIGRAQSLLEEPFGFALLAIIVPGMIGINSLLVKVALGPVKVLEETAARVARGEQEARAPSSPVADPSLRRLTETFNDMLEAGSRTGASRDLLARELLEAAERDRRLLAEELLAGPAQTLSATLLLLGGNGGARQAAPAATAAVRETLEQLRRISAALHPPELHEIGLATALRALVRSRLESRGIQVEVEVEGTERGVPSAARLGAYRLVQEAVDLAAQLPPPARFQLWLRREGRSLLTHVVLARADGPPDASHGSARPEDPAVIQGAQRATAPIRLPEGAARRMVERARLLGGDLRVEPGPSGSEIAILVRLPVEGGSAAEPDVLAPM